MEDVEAGDHAGVLGGSILRVVEACEDGDDGLGDGSSKVSSSSRASLGLAMVLGLRVRLPAVEDDLEKEVLHVGLDLSIVGLVADEALRIKDVVRGVHRDLVPRSVTDETLGVGEGDIRGGGTVTLVIGDDLTRSCC